jgi:hypothetical protein
MLSWERLTAINGLKKASKVIRLFERYNFFSLRNDFVSKRSEKKGVRECLAREPCNCVKSHLKNLTSKLHNLINNWIWVSYKKRIHALLICLRIFFHFDFCSAINWQTFRYCFSLTKCQFVSFKKNIGWGSNYLKFFI